MLYLNQVYGVKNNLVLFNLSTTWIYDVLPSGESNKRTALRPFYLNLVLPSKGVI